MKSSFRSGNPRESAAEPRSLRSVGWTLGSRALGQGAESTVLAALLQVAVGWRKR